MSTYCSVSAFEIYRKYSDDSFFDDDASNTGEPDVYIGDFDSRDAATIAAHAWAEDHSARIEGHVIVHHEVSICEMEGDDDDGCGAECVNEWKFDTIDADKRRLETALLDQENPDAAYEDAVDEEWSFRIA